MTDDTVNQTARRVAIHQAVDKIVDARLQMGHLSVPQGEDLSDYTWEALAAIAQGQLEQAGGGL